MWSDGCAAQFRSRFKLLAEFAKEHTIAWYYNERHHGKGPMDVVGSTIKHRVFPDVRSEKVHISNANHFASYVDSILKGIKSLYMAESEVLIEPDNMASAPKICSTK